jgi:HEAT repeat protein
MSSKPDCMVGRESERKWLVCRRNLRYCRTRMSTPMPQTQPTKLKDPAVRIQMVEIVSKLGNSHAVEKLLPFLIDEEDSVRQAAEKAIEQIDPQWHTSEVARKARPTFEAATRDDNYWIGLAAVEVLRKISNEKEQPVPVKEQTVPVQKNDSTEKTTVTDRFHHQRREAARILASALKDSDVDFRLAAAECLGQLGNLGFNDSLAASLNDRNEWVRWYAAQSLQAVQWQPADDKQKAAFLVSLRKWDDAVQLGELSAELLIAALKSCNSNVREGAAVALGKLKAPSAELPLGECLQDKNRNVRKAAAKSLSIIGPKNLTPEQKNILIAELRS